MAWRHSFHPNFHPTFHPCSTPFHPPVLPPPYIPPGGVEPAGRGWNPFRRTTP